MISQVLKLEEIYKNYLNSNYFYFVLRLDQKRPVFFGNQTDYFQILDQDDNSVLIGAR